MATTTVRGQTLRGTEIGREIINQLQNDVTSIKKQFPGFQPRLAIVQVGDREDSNVYIRMKIKAALDIGMTCDHVKLPRSITESELLRKLRSFNADPNIHGIVVQMPLDSDNKIDVHLVTNTVYPEKDVDGLNTVNEGKIAVGDLSGFVPCTPNGVIELAKRSGVNFAGAQAVVIGRSKIVGTPVSELLKWNHATVTVCHSKTKDLKEQCQKADILVVAIGQPELVKASWIKPGAVVIDCGINSVSDGIGKTLDADQYPACLKDSMET